MTLSSCTRPVIRFLALALLAGALHPAEAKTAVCLAPACTEFPSDAGALNVHDFGAKGDGVTDDTAAINAALTASGGDEATKFWRDKIVYFPDGTYLVSSPIAKRYANGQFGSGSILIGQSREHTVIRLTDHAAGYDNPARPLGVIMTTAKLLDGDATSGGKDYTHKGEGNDAYENFVENMTVDVGNDNAGAIGIDYLANNMGAIRHVLVHANTGSGTTGIALTRKWPGPALLKDVTVEGFDTSIDVANTEYGVTMEDIRLLRPRSVGLRNTHNVVSIHDLTIADAPLPIANQAPDGLIVIIDSKITNEKADGTDAIQNKGYLNLRSVKVQGYASVLGTPTPPRALDGIYENSKRLSASQASWSLPITDAPPPYADPVQNWVSVATYGAKPDGTDATAGIRKAFASGASTIYFPHGTYLIKDNIAVPSTVRRIVGMMSAIHVYDGNAYTLHRDQGMFRAMNHQFPLSIEHMAFDNSDFGDQVGVEAASSEPLILRDIVGAGVTTLKRPATSGSVFVEDTCCGRMDIAGRNPVWMRQLNTEGLNVRIENKGAPLWILGIKTEGNCTAVENRDGARTEVLGGLLYIVRVGAGSSAVPAFRNYDSQMLLSYAEEGFQTKSLYTTHLLDSEMDVEHQVDASSLPSRNLARMVPLFTTSP